MDCPSIPFTTTDGASWFCLFICTTCTHTALLHESSSLSTSFCPACHSPTTNFDSDFGTLTPHDIPAQCLIFNYKHWWRCWSCESFVQWTREEEPCGGCGWRGCVVVKVWEEEGAGWSREEIEGRVGRGVDLGRLGGGEVLFWGEIYGEMVAARHRGQ